MADSRDKQVILPHPLYPPNSGGRIPMQGDRDGQKNPGTGCVGIIISVRSYDYLIMTFLPLRM